MHISAHLQRKLQESLGADASQDLVTMLEGIGAIRGDLGELRHEMQLGFARIEARFQQVDSSIAKIEQLSQTSQAKTEGAIATGKASMEALLEKGLREQARFFFLAWSVLLAAIIGLYAR